MEYLKVFGIIFVVILVIYAPIPFTPLTNFQKSIQSSLPDAINRFFHSPPLVNVHKIGLIGVACISNAQCKESYPEHPNITCNIQDGYCYD